MLDGEYDIGDQITLEGIAAALPAKGSIERGSTQLHISDPTGWADNDPIVVAGAAPEGGDLITTVSSRAAYTFTLATAAGRSVVGADVGKLLTSTVELKVRRPSSAVADTVTASAISTGRWQGLYTAVEAGEHYYRFGSSGALLAQAERRFYVRDRRVV